MPEENVPEGYGGAAAPKEGAPAYAKKKTRKRAARVLRRKKKAVKKGGYIAFVKKYMAEHKGASIADAAKAWSKEKKAAA